MKLERKKKSMVVNGKGAPAKKPAAKKKAPTKKRPQAAKAEAPKRRRRPTKRKKNPSIDMKGSVAAMTGGALAVVLAGPATAAVDKLVKGETARKALRPLAAGIVPFGVGLAAQTVVPNLGKGLCAGAGAQLATHALSAAASRVDLLAAAGYRMSDLPADFRFRDGQLWRRMPDGTEKVMFHASATKVELTMPDGSKTTAQMLGAEGDQVVILDELGQLKLLTTTPLSGIQERTPLAGIKPATPLSGGTQALGYTA